jgi:hypothetical protein
MGPIGCAETSVTKDQFTLHKVAEEHRSHLHCGGSLKASSSSTGTTARCGLWPVEKYPSIFSYLSPTLSTIVKSIQLFPLFDFRNNKFFYCVGLLGPRQTPNLEDQGIPFLSGSSPLTWLAWEALLVA